MLCSPTPAFSVSTHLHTPRRFGLRVYPILPSFALLRWSFSVGTPTSASAPARLHARSLSPAPSPFCPRQALTRPHPTQMPGWCYINTYMAAQVHTGHSQRNLKCTNYSAALCPTRSPWVAPPCLLKFRRPRPCAIHTAIIYKMSAAALAELKAELRDLEGYESDTPFDENFNDEGVNKVGVARQWKPYTRSFLTFHASSIAPCRTLAMWL